MLVERVGSGPWNASIWKRDGDEDSQVWFVMDEEAENNPRCKHGAEEIFTLVKLAQVLAATFVFEGCVEGSLRGKLLELAEAIDEVLGKKEDGWLMLGEESSPPPAAN